MFLFAGAVKIQIRTLDFVRQQGINVGSDSFSLSLSLLPLVLILFGLLSFGLVSLDLISDYLNNSSCTAKKKLAATIYIFTAN